MRRQQRRFLWSASKAIIAELRRFSAILRAILADFSASQTVWRSAQSGANLSPREFPVNREKYREFARFCTRKSHSSSLNCTF
jgi:hypothetical protein